MCSSLVSLLRSSSSAISPTILASSLIDALFALTRHRRAAILLSVCLQANLPFAHDPHSHSHSHSHSRSYSHPQPHSLSQSRSHSDGNASAGFEVALCDGNTWRLDVRRLSTGGAVVALRQWLAKLVHVIAATESTSADADVEGVAVCVGSSSLLLSESTLGPHLLNPNSCWALPEIIVQLMPVHAGRMRCAEEEGAVVEGDMQSGTCVHQHHGQYAGMPTFPRAMQQRSVHASAAAAADCNTISTPPQTCDRSQASGTSDTLHQSASGRQLLIVTGWGRRARWGQSQGESKVKQAVAA